MADTKNLQMHRLKFYITQHKELIIRAGRIKNTEILCGSFMSDVYKEICSVSYESLGQ